MAPCYGGPADSLSSFDVLPAHDEHTMPDEHFETMGIAAGPDSDREQGRWHGDRGEGMRLSAAHGVQQDGMVLSTRRDRTDNMPCRRPKASQAGQDQAHQYKHFAQIRLPEQLWQAGYSISVVQSVGVPARCSDHHRLRSVVCRAAIWWHRPASAAFCGVWTKLQTNQPLAAHR
jgi:hypothetical protein